MIPNGLKKIFLKGRYADLITLVTVITLLSSAFLSLANLFPPAGLLLIIPLFYSLKYLWLYDGTNFRWRNMKAPEKAGTLGVLIGLGMSLLYLIRLGVPAFVPIAWLGLPLGAIIALFVFTFTHPEKRISQEDFFIAGWSTGSIGAVYIILLGLLALSLNSPQKLFILFSDTFFVVVFQAILHLFVTLGASLAAGYARKNFGWGGILIFTLGAFGLYLYIFQIVI